MHGWDENRIIMKEISNQNYRFGKKCANCGDIISNYATMCRKHMAIGRDMTKAVLASVVARTGKPHPRRGDQYVERGLCVTCNNPKKQNYMKYCSKKCMGIGMRGIKNWNWKGGISTQNELERKRSEFSNWRKSVFERDDYRCFDCGERGGKLQADHIFPFSLFSRLRTDIDNGQTVCEKCHRNRTSNFMREYNKGFFQGRLISTWRGR